jgi:hypothetical protein
VGQRHLEAARNHETLSVAPLLDRLHMLGIDPETCSLDKGYDNNRVYADCSDRGISPRLSVWANAIGAARCL